ncbi:tryptophan halogenase family protein [Sphingomonas abaci]|uniref:Flavin-dependent dehydrogenase n=1 Tax=Sphingomonas abaci TaxID=237611 RepID=A0A7W7AHG5_9SPHN|nr:tryptophan halogenase family protein [Sphingomonas abaci]MBB4617109.1 flavin-dependent dehydrogenase [Sphingomonas abaci]
MTDGRSILIVGGGTAGWLTAAYLARHLAAARPSVSIALLDAPEIGPIGVGEGAFPTIRATLRYLGIEEGAFLRAAGASFKQGIRFDDWLHAPADGRRHRYVHPFEPPYRSEEVDLVAHWLAQDPATRPPFAEAVTIQHRVASAGRGPKQAAETGYDGPLSYAYHFDAIRLGRLLAERAGALGVRRLDGRLVRAERTADGAIAHLETEPHGALSADLYIDCTGQRAAIIGEGLGEPFLSVRDRLFTNRALVCRLPYEREDAPLPTMTIATAHEAGWTWDIGTAEARGIGAVYSDDHMSGDQAMMVLAAYTGVAPDRLDVRTLGFEPGYRRRPWVGNCVAVGLSGGFLEPLESTGILLIEAAVAMIAELFPHHGPVPAPAARFNALMTARYEAIADFLKLHYCLSRRTEAFWRDNRAVGSRSDRLSGLLDQWRHRPPNRFDFTLDVESFAFFNYQYVLYGMDWAGDAASLPQEGGAQILRKLRQFGDHAAADLPGHRELVAALRR